MRAIASLTTAVAATGLLAGGCFHEQVAWPPTPADIARINDAGEANNWFRVDYVEPLATAQGARIGYPIAIESVDDERIAFRNRYGQIHAVPTEMVKGVTVKERAGGVAAGAGAGLGVGGLMVGGLYLLAVVLTGPDDPSAPSHPCDGACVAKTVVPILVIPTVVGGIIGYFVGGRRTFVLGRGMP